MKRSLIVAAALLLVTAGCGDSDDDNDTTTDPTVEPTASTYVSEVNRLCDALIDEVVPITGNSAPRPSRGRYLSNMTQLGPIYAEFEAEVAEIPAETADDEAAKEAFDAYLAALAAIDADLDAKATELSKSEWAAEFNGIMDAFFTSPERTAMLAAGISCPAR